MRPEGYRFVNALQVGTGGSFGEERQRQSGFHVIAKRGSRLLPWLDIHRRLVPRVPPGTLPERSVSELTLGYITTHDPLLSGMLAAIQVDLQNDLYDLSTTFFPQPPGRPSLDRTAGSNLRPLNTVSFMQELIENEALSGRYAFELDKAATVLSIHPHTLGRAVDQSRPAFTFKAAHTSYGIGYRLNLRQDGLSEEHIATFPEQMSMLAELTQHVGKALYVGHNLASEIPDTTFIIEPPHEIDTYVANAELGLDALMREVREQGYTARGIFFV